ncbi:hypothetical protein TorRG33x02_234180, partial [Trema orientale]
QFPTQFGLLWHPYPLPTMYAQLSLTCWFFSPRYLFSCISEWLTFASTLLGSLSVVLYSRSCHSAMSCVPPDATECTIAIDPKTTLSRCSLSDPMATKGEYCNC